MNSKTGAVDPSTHAESPAALACADTPAMGCVAVEARESAAVGGDPDRAVVVQQEVAHVAARQPVALVVRAHFVAAHVPLTLEDVD